MDWFVELVFRCWLEKLISGPNEVTGTLEKRAASGRSSWKAD